MKKQVKLIEQFNNQKTDMLSEITGGTGGTGTIVRTTSRGTYTITEPVGGGRGTGTVGGDVNIQN